MNAVSAARARLAALPETTAPVAAGFDGFVDEMISVVAERSSLDHFTPVPDIAAFGRLVTAAAGQSSLREIVIHATHPGGCAVNLGDGLAPLGVPVHCFATLGEPPHPAFSQILPRFASFQTWGREPGRTLAFEFSDGKLMFSAVRQLQEFTPEEVRARLADGAYLRACEASRVIALTNWTLYPHMTAVWRLLVSEVYSKLGHRPAFFFDLVDPSSRAEADIRAMLGALPSFEACGPVTLGLNGNEAAIVARLLGLKPAVNTPAETASLAAAIREALGVSEIVVHRNHFAVGASGQETAALPGPHCERPKKSTGAGDRFNAGYILGLLAGGALEEKLALGCATAGFFVRQARSASRAELASFLETWEKGGL